MKAQKRDIAGTTETTYSNILEWYIDPLIGPIALKKITQDDIERLISHLQTDGGISTNKEGIEKMLKPLSSASLRKVKFILKQAFDYAMDQELIIKNPAQRVKLSNFEKPPMKPLEQDEKKKLLETAKGIPMYIPLPLDLSTGLRRGELLALQWKDVH